MDVFQKVMNIINDRHIGRQDCRQKVEHEQCFDNFSTNNVASKGQITVW